ncbi:APC family permease [Thalassospira sp. SM2505]
MIFDLIIAFATVCVAIVLSMRSVAYFPLWRAVVTPLASIIGSGFLLLGPILNIGYGGYAPLIMLVLCFVAYLFGGAIRYNIASGEKAIQDGDFGPLAIRIETLSSWALAFAYIISVSYYLNLLGAFALSLTPFKSGFDAKLLTTAVFITIVLVGWSRGFKSLEKMEYVSVSLKLAIIAGLLVGLMAHFGHRALDDALIFNPEKVTGWSAVTLTFGLLITVQGFETSRYLGSEYDARTRIRSMRLAQWLSTAIYLVYILLISYVFRPDQMSPSETGIIDMMKIVAPILPFLLVAAALASQFSAAVADTSGSGGLFAELSRKRISERQAYLLLAVIGIALTWSADIYAIVSYASRGFAIYYGLQAGLSAVIAAKQQAGWHRVGFYALLAALAAVIAVFGQSVE